MMAIYTQLWGSTKASALFEDIGRDKNVLLINIKL
jgi:hypothetical protein